MALSPRLLAVVLLIAASLSAPAPTRAEDTGAVPARELFQRGVKAVGVGDLVAALSHFQEAYDQSPNQTVLFNIAQTQIALGRPVDGARTLRRYLELNREPAGNVRTRRVKELLAYTERRLGKIALVMKPADAALEVDGVLETPDASGTVEVAAGSRQLVLTRAGFQTTIRRVDVAPGETTSATVELSEVPKPPPPEPKATLEPEKGIPPVPANQPRALAPPPAPPSRDAEEAGLRRSWSIATGVTGGALAGVGIALLVANQSRYRDYRRDHDAFSTDLANGESSPNHPARAAGLEARAARIQRTDDIGIGTTILGGMLLAVTGTLLAWDFDL
jgi:hypothetical protein